MKAQELFEITKKNAKSIEDVIEMCETSAKVGNSGIAWYQYLSTETIAALGGMGFAVRKNTGQMGEPIYIISWEF